MPKFHRVIYLMGDAKNEKCEAFSSRLNSIIKFVEHSPKITQLTQLIILPRKRILLFEVWFKHGVQSVHALCTT